VVVVDKFFQLYPQRFDRSDKLRIAARLQLFPRRDREVGYPVGAEAISLEVGRHAISQLAGFGIAGDGVRSRARLRLKILNAVNMPSSRQQNTSINLIWRVGAIYPMSSGLSCDDPILRWITANLS